MERVERSCWYCAERRTRARHGETRERFAADRADAGVEVQQQHTRVGLLRRLVWYRASAGSGGRVVRASGTGEKCKARGTCTRCTSHSVTTVCGVELKVSLSRCSIFVRLRPVSVSSIYQYLRPGSTSRAPWLRFLHCVLWMSSICRRVQTSVENDALLSRGRLRGSRRARSSMVCSTHLFGGRRRSLRRPSIRYRWEQRSRHIVLPVDGVATGLIPGRISLAAGTWPRWSWEPRSNVST